MQSSSTPDAWRSTFERDLMNTMAAQSRLNRSCQPPACIRDAILRSLNTEAVQWIPSTDAQASWTVFCERSAQPRGVDGTEGSATIPGDRPACDIDDLLAEAARNHSGLLRYGNLGAGGSSRCLGHPVHVAEPARYAVAASGRLQVVSVPSVHMPGRGTQLRWRSSRSARQPSLRGAGVGDAVGVFRWGVKSSPSCGAWAFRARRVRDLRPPPLLLHLSAAGMRLSIQPTMSAITASLPMSLRRSW